MHVKPTGQLLHSSSVYPRCFGPMVLAALLHLPSVAASPTAAGSLVTTAEVPCSPFPIVALVSSTVALDVVVSRSLVLGSAAF